jgi:hypothetical protein
MDHLGEGPHLRLEPARHIGSASIDEPDLARRAVGNSRPFYLLLVQTVYHKPWQHSDAKGGDWYDCMGLVLQGVGKNGGGNGKGYGKRKQGTVYGKVGVTELKETDHWFEADGVHRRITIM